VLQVKVLFIDHPEADMGSAMLFLGLCQELGPENVVDWPYKESFHGKTSYIPPRYSGDPGSKSTWQEWITNKDGNCSPFTWMVPQPETQWSDDDVASNIHNFDLVILASPRLVNQTALLWLIRRVGRGSIKRLFMHDGEDYDDIRWDIIERFGVEAYFKRELVSTKVDARARIIPFPFSSPLPVLDAVEKSVDVCFLGGNNFSERGSVANALRSELGDRFVDGNQGYGTYLTTLNKSKIAISVRGHGWDPLRFYEIPSFYSTLLVSDVTPVVKPYPFTNEANCLFFDNPQHLVSVVKRYLADEGARNAVALAGNQHLREHHTTQARAKQMLSIFTR
jgi:hypothetical protein